MDRSDCYSHIQGKGLEIGPLHEPAPIPSHTTVEYFDLRTKEDSISIFDELSPGSIVEVDHVGDIDRRDLRKLGKERYDFVIASHVIEHLANPIALIEDAFFILKPKGRLVIAAPDKRFTFDKKREITKTTHCLQDYKDGTTIAHRDHYLDFIRNVLPDGQELEGPALEERCKLVQKRREHVHVWDSDTFKEFLFSSLRYLKIRANLIIEKTGDETEFEYRAVLEKKPGSKFKNILSKILGEV